MKRHVPAFRSLVAPLLVVAAPAVAQQPTFSLHGRAFETAHDQPLAGLTVNLVPPPALKRPQIVTTTDDRGNYQLAGVPAGRYLLEAYQGANLVFRVAVDVNQDSVRDIGLAPAQTGGR
jgi:hypothetical protein